jgi:hypothetical protein
MKTLSAIYIMLSVFTHNVHNPMQGFKCRKGWTRKVCHYQINMKVLSIHPSGFKITFGTYYSKPSPNTKPTSPTTTRNYTPRHKFKYHTTHPRCIRPRPRVYDVILAKRSKVERPKKDFKMTFKSFYCEKPKDRQLEL